MMSIEQQVQNYFFNFNLTEALKSSSYNEEEIKFANFAKDLLKENNYDASSISHLQFFEIFGKAINKRDYFPLLENIIRLSSVIQKENYNISILLNQKERIKLEIVDDKVNFVSGNVKGASTNHDDSADNKYVVFDEVDGKRQQFLLTHSYPGINSIHSIIRFDKVYIKDDQLHFPIHDIIVCAGTKCKIIDTKRIISSPLRPGSYTMRENISLTIFDKKEKEFIDRTTYDATVIVYRYRAVSSEKALLKIDGEYVVIMNNLYHEYCRHNTKKDTAELIIKEFGDKSLKIKHEGETLYVYDGYVLRIQHH